MFWSGETVEANLSSLIFDEHGNAIGNSSKIDCAGYTLTIGPEVFITPSGPAKSKKGHQKIQLQQKEDFQIPKGQFAFLISDEFVKIPLNVIAFISLKTGDLKFRGLINVSGFHVDPGYYGRLVFSVFNAGPQDITLQQGKDFAVIWFSELDKNPSMKNYSAKKNNGGPHLKEMPTSITGNMSGEIYSPIAIYDRLKRVEDETKNQIQTLKFWMLIGSAAFILLTVANFAGGAIAEFVKTHFQENKQENRLSIDGNVPIILKVEKRPSEFINKSKQSKKD